MSKKLTAMLYAVSICFAFVVGTNYTQLGSNTTPAVTAIPVESSPKLAILENLHPANMTAKYSDVLKTSYAIANQVDVPPTIVQAILLQESKAGNVKSLVGSRGAGVGNRSYGVMQMKVEAARSVMSRTPKLVSKYFPNRSYSSITDEEVIALMLTNHEANIRMACYHLKLYHSMMHDWDATIVAYNMGIGNAKKTLVFDTNPYLISVQNYMNTTVPSFNSKHNL
jgi:hypothetical protein